MTDLPRLPPGVMLSSSNRNNGGTLKVHILFWLWHGRWKVDKEQTNRSAMHIPLQTHIHTYRLWWRHLWRRYVMLSNGSGGGEREVGWLHFRCRLWENVAGVLEAKQCPPLARLVRHVPLTGRRGGRGNKKKPDPFIRDTPPSNDDNLFTHHVTQRPRYLSPTHCKLQSWCLSLLD